MSKPSEINSPHTSEDQILPESKTAKIFYGWWVVAGCFFILVLTVGAGLYSLPIFLVPLQEHFGWSRASISAGAAIGSISIGLMAPWVGSLIDRFSMRRVMFAGTFTMAIGFASYAATDSLWHFWISSAVLAIGLSMVAFVPVQTLISVWFTRRRGLAMGVTLAGIGFGGLFLAPLTGAVISGYGWRTAYVCLAIIVTVPVALILLLVVRDSPATLGLLADGDPISRQVIDSPEGGPVVPGSNFGEAVATKVFWALTATVFFASFASFGLIQHLAALLTDSGYSMAVSSSTLGMAIGFSVVGRVLAGALSDKFEARWVYAALVALITLATGVLLSPSHGLSLIFFSIFFGIGLGGINVLLPLLVGMCFGLKSFSKILGVVILAATLGSSIGPLAVGVLFDLTGDYAVALPALILFGALAMFSVAFVQRPN